jgi:hypothetical protein
MGVVFDHIKEHREVQIIAWMDRRDDQARCLARTIACLYWTDDRAED